MYIDKELKQYLKEIIKRNIFILTVTNLSLLTTMKLTKIGLPYYKDSQKKYYISTTSINNYNDKKIIERYLYNKELLSFKKDNKLYIKDKLEYQDNTYTRNVKVYKLKEEDNYEDILKKYKEYINNKNLIDEYQETTNIIKKPQQDYEIIVEYYTVDKDKYIKIYESDIKNNISSIIYSIALALTTTAALYDTIDNTKNINNSLKKKKKLKKDN